MTNEPMEITNLADALARISWQDAEIEGLQQQIKIKDLKFDRLCKDMDARNEYVDELKRIIAGLRTQLDRRDEAIREACMVELMTQLVHSLSDKSITIKRNGMSIKGVFISGLAEMKGLKPC